MSVGSGCPRPEVRVAAPRAGGAAPPVLRLLLSRSELEPITSVTAFSRWIYAGTPKGLLRFDRDDGHFRVIERMDGIPDAYRFGNQGEPLGPVLGVSGHTASGLWVAREQGLARLKDEVWTRYDYHPLLGLPASLLLATADDLWIGATRNLAVFRDAWWSGFLRGSRVTYLLEDHLHGGVFVGTDGDGVFRHDQDGFDPQGRPEGQLVQRVRSITYNRSWGVMAVGSSGTDEFLAFFDGRYWTSYRVDPPGRLGWVQQVGDQTLLAYKDQVLRLKSLSPVPRGGSPEEKPLPQGSVRLVMQPSPQAPPGYPGHHFYTEPSGLWLPTTPTSVVGYQSFVLFGTDTMGIALFDGKGTTWYRTRALLGDNGRLRMACDETGEEGCFLPGVGGQAWRLRGEGFEPLEVPGGPGSRVEGFATGRAGEVLAVSTPRAGRSLRVSVLRDGRFERLMEVEVALPPESTLEVRFVRTDPQGRLWVGLWVSDAEDRRNPWGAVVLEVPKAGHLPNLVLPAWAEQDDGGNKTEAPTGAAEPLLFHRSTLLFEEERPPGSLALPDDLRDVFFDGETTWVSTGTGLLRVRGDEVVSYTENEGLASEIVYASVRGPSGQVLAATLGGVGRQDGADWRFDLGEALRRPARALIVDPDGSLWVGTSRGLVGLRGGLPQVFDETRGLIDDDVTDLFLDSSGRLFVLAGGGLSIIQTR